jgi:hypothetical protein
MLEGSVPSPLAVPHCTKEKAQTSYDSLGSWSVPLLYHHGRGFVGIVPFRWNILKCHTLVPTCTPPTHTCLTSLTPPLHYTFCYVPLQHYHSVTSELCDTWYCPWSQAPCSRACVCPIHGTTPNGPQQMLKEPSLNDWASESQPPACKSQSAHSKCSLLCLWSCSLIYMQKSSNPQEILARGVCDQTEELNPDWTEKYLAYFAPESQPTPVRATILQWQARALVFKKGGIWSLWPTEWVPIFFQILPCSRHLWYHSTYKLLLHGCMDLFSSGEGDN